MKLDKNVIEAIAFQAQWVSEYVKALKAEGFTETQAMHLAVEQQKSLLIAASIADVERESKLINMPSVGLRNYT